MDQTVYPQPISSRWLRDRRAKAAVGAVLAASAALLIGWPALRAQIEGERGIAPIASTGDYQIDGIEVMAEGKDGEDARLAGWAEARRKGWEKLWAERGGGGNAPKLSDSQLDSMTSAIAVQKEEVGPHRYIATLGVVFDRTRASQYLGIAGPTARSAPLLIIPVLYEGGTGQVFETRNGWQNAWAQFRAGESLIDYVRPNGAGSESLMVTAGQPGRRSRILWRNLLDYFGASDVLIAMARTERQYPGGPARVYFTARHGPDDRFLASFTLTAANDDALPALYAEAVKRFDRIFTQSLLAGTLTPDSTLQVRQTIDRGYIDGLIDELGGPRPVERAAPVTAAPGAPLSVVVPIQAATPDAASVDAILAAVRGTPGVQSAVISSTAIGGTSVLRVSYAGTMPGLSAALSARGFQVSSAGAGFAISR